METRDAHDRDGCLEGESPTKLAENHERIWLQPLCEVDERCWCQDPQPCDECGMEAIEYIRLDVAIAGGYKRRT